MKKLLNYLSLPTVIRDNFPECFHQSRKQLHSVSHTSQISTTGHLQCMAVQMLRGGKVTSVPELISPQVPSCIPAFRLNHPLWGHTVTGKEYLIVSCLMVALLEHMSQFWGQTWCELRVSAQKTVSGVLKLTLLFPTTRDISPSENVKDMSVFLFRDKKYIYTLHLLQKQFCAISNLSRDILSF